MYRSAVILSLLVSVTACAAVEAPSAGPSLCAAGWAQAVETSLGSGDGSGHGPDAGSDEWQSVVEFRLGVRGLTGLPARGSAPWCAYIEALAADTTPVQYVCEDAEAATLNVHFLATEPPTMIARRGDVLSLLTLQRSASGARFQGDDMSFWEHHGEARVTWGTDTADVRCQALP